MTDEDDRTRSDARGSELRSELAATDARRAEEETSEAHEAVEAAEAEEEKRAREEKEARQRAKAAEDEAQRRRKQAEETAASHPSTPKPASAPSSVAAGGAPTDKPEVMIGAAFAGAFVFAQIFKRLVD